MSHVFNVFLNCFFPQDVENFLFATTYITHYLMMYLEQKISYKILKQAMELIMNSINNITIIEAGPFLRSSSYPTTARSCFIYSPGF